MLPIPLETKGYADIARQIEGIYGEVVVSDNYLIKQFADFQATVIVDIGANIGIFSRYAIERFPQARVVMVEPDPISFDILSQLVMKAPKFGEQVLINKGIGNGTLYLCNGSVSCGGMSYVSPGIGFKEDVLQKPGRYVESIVPCLHLSEIFEEHVKKEDKVILKIDCEGGENDIYEHEASFKCLQRADYICAEVHRYGLDIEGRDSVVANIEGRIRQLQETHWIMRRHVMMYARRKV